MICKVNHWREFDFEEGNDKETAKCTFIAHCPPRRSGRLCADLRPVYIVTYGGWGTGGGKVAVIFGVWGHQ